MTTYANAIIIVGSPVNDVKHGIRLLGFNPEDRRIRYIASNTEDHLMQGVFDTPWYYWGGLPSVYRTAKAYLDRPTVKQCPTLLEALGKLDWSPHRRTS